MNVRPGTFLKKSIIINPFNRKLQPEPISLYHNAYYKQDAPPELHTKAGKSNFFTATHCPMPNRITER
jgi:hypothetical protein